jgi:hypothetical protein
LRIWASSLDWFFLLMNLIRWFSSQFINTMNDSDI